MSAATSAGMKRVIELGVVIGSLLAGCAAGGEANQPGGAGVIDEDDPALQGVDPTTVEEAPGDPVEARAVPAPSIAYAGSSSVTPLPSAAGGGGVRIDGGTEEGAFALVSYRVAVRGDTATAQFTVAPAAGASFIYDLTGSGSGYSTRKLRLSRVPGSSQLQATSATGEVVCGPLGDSATPVTLVYRGASKTFDVTINGQATACTGLATRMKGPAVGFNLMDASNAGYGGQVTFTGLALR